MSNYNNTERNAEIIRRRKAGEWPRAIARSMGLTHNVVIGVCGRAGLSSPAGNQLVVRGEDSPNAKLNETFVAEIRRDHVPGTNRWQPGNTAILAQKYGISKERVAMVVKRRGWAHVA